MKTFCITFVYILEMCCHLANTWLLYTKDYSELSRSRLHYLTNHHIQRGRKTILILQFAFANGGNLTQAASKASEYAIHYNIASLHFISKLNLT